MKKLTKLNRNKQSMISLFCCNKIKLLNNLIKLSLVFVVFLLAKSPVCQTSDSDLYIEVIGRPEIAKEGSELSDTITLKFNLLKNRNTRNQIRYSYLNENDDVKVTATETIGDDKKVIPPTYIEGSLKKLKKGVPGEEGSIPSDITISLLIDRSGSINEEEMAKIKEAVRAFVNNVPEGCLYFSWFNDDISSSIPLTKENFEEANFTTSSKNTALFNAIYTKLLEFDNTSVLPNIDLEPMERNMDIGKRKSLNNYLIVLTDGVNDVEDIPKYAEDDMEEIRLPKLLSSLEKYKNGTKVYALGFGENSDDFDEQELIRICMASGNPNGYFLAKPDSILQLLKMRLTDEMIPDYEVKLLNQKGKTYQGNLRNLSLEINAPSAKIEKAAGSVSYAMGSTVHPIVVGKESIGGIFLRGLIAGLVFLLVIMIIIQLIIPLIKNKIFNAKYVKKYKPAENELRKECQFCGDPINEGELIVMKCQHVVHKVCWGDFGYVCPEYGQNCNDGKQNYFDINDPFSKKNKIYYLKWVFFGLIGGLLTWIFFLLMKDLSFIQGISYKILTLISPNISDESIIELFTGKIASLLLIGILMGLFLTFFFGYVEDFRRKNLRVVSHLLLRGLIGSLAGFISFFLGSIILILLKQPYTSFIFDWIPWVIFGSFLGFVLSIKSTIVWKHGVIGGLISIIFSFFVLFFMVRDLGYPALLIGFMLYGAGLGFAIATVRSAAEHYFLKIIEGKKHEETIPVHKWMSFQGGHNEVYIGSGFSCEIQMNWEKNNPEIAERHAKMYINTSRNMPVIVSLEKDMLTTYDSRLDMETGKEYDLLSGTTFKIGTSVFQYVEKDK